MPGPDVPQSVIVLHRGARLGADLLALLGQERLVDVIGAPVELDTGRPPADIVVVDVPPQDRRAICEQVRHHYRGPLVVLLNLGDNSHDLPPDYNRTLLARPFSIRDLSVALATSTPTQPGPGPLGHLRLVPPHEVQDSRNSDRVAPAVPRLVTSWRERRLLRVSVIAIAAASAFTSAFVLTNQNGGCRPGCDELTGADLASPSSSFQAIPIGPDTTESGVATVASAATDSSIPEADGGSPIEATTSGAARIPPTTAWRSSVSGSTSSPGPTRPQTTAPPPTAPKTTTTTASTTTTTTTSTTITTATTTGP